ncbi:hypothetical protein L6R52_09340 [Myxococcota bacterium]|nr:hypothetical protein [Myxococcota bacterium]
MLRVCPATLTLALVAALGLTACKSTSPHDPAAREASPTARPAWTTVAHFVTPRTEGGVTLAGVGTEVVEGLDARCVEPRFVVERATSKARVELAKLVALGTSTITGATATTETSTAGTTTRATISGSERRRAWLDADGRVHVLIAMDSPETTATNYPAHLRLEIPLEGVNPVEIPGRVAEFNRRQLEAAGFCADPHRRADYPCCGPSNGFCADPTRFDHRPTADTCACGTYDPCLHDFRCEVRGGAPRCLCRGPSCPCGDLTCRDGQTCGDGRCY